MNVTKGNHLRSVGIFVGVVSSLASVVVVVVDRLVLRWTKSSSLLFLEKTRSRYWFSSDKLSIVLYTSCARRVRVLIVVALCDVGP